MPQHSNKHNKPSWKSQYVEHDFRSNETRRVTFKPSKSYQRKDNHNRDWSTAVRSHLQDEDVDMGATSSMRNINHKKKFQQGGRRSGSPAPHNMMRRKVLESPSGWYKITLPYGNKYEKEFIWRILSEKVNPLNFSPIGWTVNGSTVSFFIDDFKLAEKLNSMDRSIPLPDGYRLGIRVNNGMPSVMITSDMKEKMKLAMAKRFNSATKALDLSRFHADPDLQKFFCTLAKPSVFSAVLDIIGENVPQLEALSLDENKLFTVFYTKRMTDNMKHLKILRLANNRINDFSKLDNLTDLPILDLVLEGNPICNKYTKDAPLYVSRDDQPMWQRIFLSLCDLRLRVMFAGFTVLNRAPHGATIFSVCSEVRKRFPKVLKLDGVDLDPPIGFDLEENINFPDPRQTFLCNTEGEGIVRQFLEQYFKIFDSDDRKSLLHAYHENASFSLTVAYPYGQKDKNTAWLNWYSTESRNILKVVDMNRRMKLLKHGHVSIIAFIQDMPETRHDIHSFTADLSVFTPQMLCFTVTGIFKELKSGHKQPPLRYFHRTFVIVPFGTGFCIINEMVHITNCLESQIKKAFVIPIPTVVVEPPTPGSTPNTSLDVSGPSSLPDVAQMQAMVVTMSEQSGMNFEWSKKCLDENGWDFQKAALNFADLQKRGVVPPEAFVK